MQEMGLATLIGLWPVDLVYFFEWGFLCYSYCYGNWNWHTFSRVRVLCGEASAMASGGGVKSARVGASFWGWCYGH